MNPAIELDIVVYPDVLFDNPKNCISELQDLQLICILKKR